MCGLAGIVDPSGRSGKNETHEMALRLAHRGPDDHTDWADDVLPVALSFRRLAILDLSPDGNQPMHFGPLTIAFNGEIYNYKELRAQLQNDHHCVFKTTSDTEVLLQACYHWGVASALARVNGMYAIALVDRRDGSITLARDRFGEKPLYYACHDGALFFASELKAIAAHITPRINQSAVKQYLRYGFIPAPATIYEGVRALQPSEMLRFFVRDPIRAPLVECLAPIVAVPPEDNDPKKCFEKALQRAIDLRLRADVPVGVFLSGGIDSSLLLLMASRALGAPLPSFTIQMNNAQIGYDETPQAKNIAALCGSAHHILPLDDRILCEALPAYVASLDQPLADAAMLPTALLSQMAAGHVKVVLGGEGGDELQAGYTRHARETMLRILFALRPVLKPLWPLFKTVTLNGKYQAQVLRQMDKLAGFINTQAADSYDALMTLWPTDIGDDQIILHGDYRQRDKDFYLPHDLLMKLDGATMAASIEGRCPYLDPDLWAVVAGLPRARWAHKKLAKDLLRDLAGDAGVPQSKRGLTLPLADWLRGDLRDWAEVQLSNARALGLVNPHEMDAQWHMIVNGQTQHAQPIWALCILTAWLKEHA